MKEEISILIPVFNEEESIKYLIDEILEVLQKNRLNNYEILIVDDGSTDNTWDIVKKNALENNNIKGSRLLKNFGKSIALNIGFFIASKNYVITLDGDLQDNPNDIPKFISELKKFDFVVGWKKKRYDPVLKLIQSKIFNFFTRFLTGIKLNDFNCGFKGYNKKLVKQLNIYGGLHRYIPIIVSKKKYSICEIIVNHRKRKFGKSKYGITRVFRGLVDLIFVLFNNSFYKKLPMNKKTAKKYIKETTYSLKLD